jgi:predicted RNA-binding Zn-ribbon protein involved in translation (DUF1610 family)
VGVAHCEQVEARSRDTEQQANTAVCPECGQEAVLQWTGWRAYRVDDPETGKPPALAFYCPNCAEREFTT